MASYYDENTLDRDTYRILKQMSREELGRFLRHYYENAAKEVEENHFKLQFDSEGNYAGMNRDMFKIIHSELIQQVQCCENNLRIILATLNAGEFLDNYDQLSKHNFGMLLSELKKLDRDGSLPELTDDDYQVINDIRKIRNYWCHQCYIDFSLLFRSNVI